MLICVSHERPVDACPGMLRPFLADDGAIVRVRAPGGRIRTETLRGLANVARTFGSGVLQLTSRGNIQIRGVQPSSTVEGTEALVPAPLVNAVRDLGLLPSASHERVRNIVAASTREVDPLVADLDAGLVADAGLAELPGRWLFVLADRDGHGLDAPFDVAYQDFSDGFGRLVSGGLSWPVSRSDAVSRLLEMAARFLATRSSQRVWNVRDLPPDSPYFARAQAGTRFDAHGLSTALAPGQHGADLAVGIPFGFLTPEHVEAITDVGANELVVTHTRMLVLRDVGVSALDELTRSGLFLTTTTDPRSRVSACVGAPYCRRTDSPTLSIATAIAPHVPLGQRVHISGCDRECGKPTTPYVPIVNPQTLADCEGLIPSA